VGCSPGRFPIHLLPPTTQKNVYQHIPNVTEAKALFAGLTDARTRNDRLDPEDEDRGHLIVDALGAWEAPGFPGTWPVWWERSYAQHAEERKDILAWMDAETDLSFSEWKTQRKRGD
jgi:hypothetical protein